MKITTSYNITTIDELITLIDFRLIDEKEANRIAEFFFKIRIGITDKKALIEKIEKFRLRLESVNYDIEQNPETYYKRILSGDVTN